jgi:DNA-binding CsgD family transcriptional regulator
MTDALRLRLDLCQCFYPMNSDRYDALIRKTYAAVGDQNQWPGLIVEWADALKADSALLFTPGGQFNSLPAIGHRIDFEKAKDYGEYYHHHDVWRFDAQEGGFFLPGRTVLGEAVVSQSVLHKTLFYNDFLRQMDQEWLMGSMLMSEDNGLDLPETVLSFYRRPGRPAFGRDVAHALQRATPHLQRSLLLHHELMKTRTERTLLESGLDQLDAGVVLLDSSGRVTFANRPAQTWLRPAIHNDAPPVASLLKQLQQLDRRARLGEYCGKRLLTANGVIYAFAAPNNRFAHDANERPAQGSVLWLLDTSRGVNTAQGSLRIAASLFSLTPSEVKVLEMLMEGCAPKEIAQRQEVGLSTVRTQISSVLHKTCTRRQQDLLRLMAAFPRI